MAGYLVGGRFLTGEITLRKVIPRSCSVELVLNGAESIDVGLTLPMVDPATGVAIDIPNQLLPERDFLAWVENDTVLAAGQIQGDPFTFPGSSSIKVAGMGEYFEHRFVLPILAAGQLPRDVTSQWSGLSLRTIAKRLVQQARSHPASALPIDLEADETGDHEREYPGSDGMSVAQALANLTNVEGGPDISFRPKMAEDRRHIRWDMLTGDPQLTQGGADHYWDLSAPGPHAAVASLVRDGRDLASRSFLTGATVRNKLRNSTLVDEVGTWIAGGSNGTLIRFVRLSSSPVPGVTTGTQTTWSGTGSGGAFVSVGGYESVEEGVEYSVSVWAWANVSKQVRLAMQWGDDENGSAGSTDIAYATLPANTWVRISGTVSAPTGVEATRAGPFLYTQTGQAWTSGNMLRTLAWMFTEGSNASLPYTPDDVQIQARAGNPALLDAGFPLMESWENRSSVLRESTLQAYADESVVRYSAFTETFTLQVKRNMHPKLGTYWPGDWARIRIGKNPRIPADTYRVRIVRVSFQAEGDVTIECAPERVAGGYPVPTSNRAWLTGQLRALSARVDEQNRG